MTTPSEGVSTSLMAKDATTTNKRIGLTSHNSVSPHTVHECPTHPPTTTPPTSRRDSTAGPGTSESPSTRAHSTARTYSHISGRSSDPATTTAPHQGPTTDLAKRSLVTSPPTSGRFPERPTTTNHATCPHNAKILIRPTWATTRLISPRTGTDSSGVLSDTEIGSPLRTAHTTTLRYGFQRIAPKSDASPTEGDR